MNSALPIEVMLVFEDDRSLVIHTAYHDPWTWDDFYAALAEEDKIIRKAGSRTIYRVVDLTETRFIPSGAITHLGKMTSRLRQNRVPYGMTIFVITNSFILSLGRLLCKLFPKAARYTRQVTTLPEAYTLIQRLSSDDEF